MLKIFKNIFVRVRSFVRAHKRNEKTTVNENLIAKEMHFSEARYRQEDKRTEDSHSARKIGAIQNRQWIAISTLVAHARRTVTIP